MTGCALITGYVGRFPYPPPNIDYISLYHRTFTSRYGYHCFEFFWVLPTLYWTLCLDPVNRWWFLHKMYWEWVAQYAACSFSGLTTDGSMVDRYACVFVVLFCVLFFYIILSYVLLRWYFIHLRRVGNLLFDLCMYKCQVNIADRVCIIPL